MKRPTIQQFWPVVLMAHNCHLSIFKRKTQPKDKIPIGVFVHIQQKGWMDENGMKLWLQNVWSRRHGGLLRKPSLLV